MDEIAKEYLLNSHGEYDFIRLVDFCIEQGIPIKAAHIKHGLGLSYSESIYIDIDKLSSYPDKLVFWLLFHEMYHFKNIKKRTLKELIKIFAEPDFDTFFEILLQEEIGADRYACLMFYKFTGQVYPIEYTQQLTKPAYAERYKKEVAPMLFGKISSLDGYHAFIKSFIHEIC
jgi:hypothetical protein